MAAKLRNENGLANFLGKSYLKTFSCSLIKTIFLFCIFFDFQSMSSRLYCLLFLFFIGLFSPAYSQNTYRYEIGVQNDNDIYLLFGQDRYYTNGVDFFFTKAMRLSPNSEKFENKIWSLHIGQKLYNAHSGSTDTISLVDRPITGYLYASGEIKWFFKNEDVLSLGTEVGLIGPQALGKEVQEGYHKLFNFYKIKGWEYQLNNAGGIDIRAKYSRFLFRNSSEKWDGFLTGQISLGLNNTRVSAGPNFRYGRFNRMYESAEMGARVNSENTKSQNEAYLFYRPQINWVVYNSTIQGGMLIDDKGPVTYDVKPFVLSQVVGVQWNSNRIGLNFNYTFNTKEVKSKAVPHQYGSLRLSYYF